MKILNFAGATAILEHNGKRMLFDPWLDDGIFHGSWFHFPPSALGVKDMGHLDYVYISHIHEDHCSAETIRHINPDAEIILMDRTPNLVLNFLKNHGFNFKKIHFIKPRNPIEIAPGIIVDIVEPNPADEMARLIDSSLVVNWDGFVIFNANDCQPHQEGIKYLLEMYSKIDLALLPYSGGSGYPSCYINLTDEEKIVEKNRIMNNRINSFINSVRLLNPIHVIPFADQWAVGGSRSHLNKFVSHSSCRGVVEKPFAEANLPSNLLLLNSGQEYDFSSQQRTPNENYKYLTDDDRDIYISNSLSNAIYDHERFSFNPSVSLNRLVQYARARQWEIQKKQDYFPDYSFYLDSSDTNQRFHISLKTFDVRSATTDYALIEPYLRIVMPRDLMVMLLIGHVSWNIADAAFFLDYERIPNKYDPKIYALLNYLRI
jgi:UDP-MurNAc hydroxylase